MFRHPTSIIPRHATRRVSRLLRLVVAVIFSVAATAPSAAQAGLVFADGFESGGLCAWQGSCPAPAEVTGTWIGGLDIGGPRTVALQIRQRADGELFGYLLGGTAWRTVLSGGYGAGTFTLALELANRTGAVRDVQLDGTVEGELLAVTVSGDVPTHTTTFRRTSENLAEQRLVAVASVAEGSYVDVALLVGADGSVLGGGFVGAGGPWSDEGWVVGMDGPLSSPTLHLVDDGGCTVPSTLSIGPPDAGGLSTGTWTWRSCPGEQTGDLIASRSGRGESTDLADIFAGLAAVMDQLESGVAFGASHPTFAPGYLHNGATALDVLTALNAEQTAWDDIEVALGRFRNAVTVDDPGVFVDLRRPTGLEFDEERSGVPSALRGARTTYLESAGDLYWWLNGNSFGLWQVSAAGWGSAGNGQPAFDLPFDYALPPAGSRELLTSGAATFSLGGYGAHTSPLTGHAEGNMKTDIFAFLVAQDGLTEVVGDGDGVREDGETWAFGPDPGGATLHARNVTYRMPHDGEVRRIRIDFPPSSSTLGGYPDWRLRVRFGNGVEMDLVHIGRFDAGFAADVEAATGCNPNDLTSTCPSLAVDEDLLDGLAPLPFGAGDELVQPRILAVEVPGHPGFWEGVGGGYPYPWGQVEFFVNAPLRANADSACVYRLLPQERQDSLRAVLAADMTSSSSRRYYPHGAALEWGWRAEGRLCNAETETPRDFASLDSGQGGWWERDEAATTANEILAIFPIQKGSPVYDASLYQSAAVDHLVTRARTDDGPFSWTMPDASSLEVFYPLGEVLERTASSLLIKWREIGYTASDVPVYQRVAYELDADGLRLRWGSFADSPAAAVQPTLTPGEACDDSVVMCFDHGGR